MNDIHIKLHHSLECAVEAIDAECWSDAKVHLNAYSRAVDRYKREYDHLPRGLSVWECANLWMWSMIRKYEEEEAADYQPPVLFETEEYDDNEVPTWDDKCVVTTWTELLGVPVQLEFDWGKGHE